MRLCLKYLVHLFKWRVGLGVWEVVFIPIPEEIEYSFFNFLFDVFWNSINDHLFTFQRESHSVPDMDFFCYNFTYFVPFGVIENRVTKINLMYFNGNCDYSICPD